MNSEFYIKYIPASPKESREKIVTAQPILPILTFISALNSFKNVGDENTQ
jgi:hypothetical protein